MKDDRGGRDWSTIAELASPVNSRPSRRASRKDYREAQKNTSSNVGRKE